MIKVNKSKLIADKIEFIGIAPTKNAKSLMVVNNGVTYVLGVDQNALNERVKKALSTKLSTENEIIDAVEKPILKECVKQIERVHAAIEAKKDIEIKDDYLVLFVSY